jgi:superfamily II RNA helicase
VSKLTSEKDTLSGQTKDQAEQYGKLRDDYFALEKQCNSVAEERSSLESLVAKLTDEKENLEAQSEQHKTAALVVEAELRTKKDETKAALDESRKANQRLDEMLAYCEKLKKVNQEQATKLKKDLEEQTTSLNEVIQSLSNQIKSIEAEKEQNRTMYETDIELQQSVSFFCDV